MKKLNQKRKAKIRKLKSVIPNRHPFFIGEVGNKQNACCSKPKKCMNS